MKTSRYTEAQIISILRQARAMLTPRLATAFPAVSRR